MHSEKKKNRFEIDMCNGSIMNKLISFSIPLMLSGILQLAFNAVDIVVVGRFSGSEALAAVGSTTALINVFTNLFRLNHKFCGISDSSRSSVGSYRIASERNIRHQDIRIPVCEES